MEYSAIHNQLIISTEDVRRATIELQYTMRSIRDSLKVPRGKRPKGPLEDIDHIERGLIMTAKQLGINLGAEWGHEIDLTLD